MEDLVKKYEGKANFLFIYVREAHPGELIPEHESYEQKVAQAKMLADRGNTRQIVVDDVNGEVHRQYGGLPNMSWIIDHTGRVAYKASWTDSVDIDAALEEAVTLREKKAKGEMANEFYRETVGIRLTRPEGPGLLGGERAQEDSRKVWEARAKATAK
ncbi:MAG: hypothetical protein IIC27_04605 [Chloroflexi bacterium]|nr:hypothetical protein [Chloroflexota bacterium]